MHSLQNLKRLALTGIALTAIFACKVQAVEQVAPRVDTAPLPAQAQTWQEPNPLRGNAQAAVIGRQAFNQSCAVCHGQDANGTRAPAPDLRRMGGRCNRIGDAALRERCQGDADAFFIKSVRYGKQKFGIVHMPPWDGVIGPELAWALRSFVETAPKGSGIQSLAPTAAATQ